MKTFKNFINEAVIKGKEVASFNYKIGKENIDFTINFINNEYRLNVNGTEKMVSKLDDKSIENAKLEIDKIVNKVGAERFLSVINQNKAEVEQKKNDTDWQLFSEFNTSRGSTAFKVYHRISNGKDTWKQEGRTKSYLSIHMSSKVSEVKNEIRNEIKNSKSKMKYVAGWNPDTDD